MGKSSRIFVKADLHIHSHFSGDCDTTIKQVVVGARRRGINLIALTDHDTMAGCEEAITLGRKSGVHVIPGAEITTEDGTHILGLFIKKLPAKGSLISTILEIKSQGGISILPHPFRSRTGLLYNSRNNRSYTQKDIQRILKLVDGLEAINYKSELRGEMQGCEIMNDINKPFFGSSDAHYDFEIGGCYTNLIGLHNEPIEPDQILLCEREVVYFKNHKKQATSSNNESFTSDYYPNQEVVKFIKRCVPGSLYYNIKRQIEKFDAYMVRRNRRNHHLNIAQSKNLELLTKNADQYHRRSYGRTL